MGNTGGRPRDSNDPIRIGAGFYLIRNGQVAAKPYKLLRQALGRFSRVVIVKWVWHGRERLGLLRAHDDALVLHFTHWPDEIRPPPRAAAAGGSDRGRIEFPYGTWSSL